jgi:formylglycine-generating enzyme required for sulfatase activity
MASLSGFANFLAPFVDRFGFTAPVGSFRPNGFGLYDMYGNVSELCRDGRGSYSMTVRPADGLRQTEFTNCIARGGSFSHRARDVRSANRVTYAPTHRHDHLGVRLARALLP